MHEYNTGAHSKQSEKGKGCLVSRLPGFELRTTRGLISRKVQLVCLARAPTCCYRLRVPFPAADDDGPPGDVGGRLRLRHRLARAAAVSFDFNESC